MSTTTKSEPPKLPDPVDIDVGRRIRQARLSRRMSQIELGSRLGVSFQQVQKYERGTNRVSASKLQKIADALDVSPHYFFDRMSKAGNGLGANAAIDESLIDFLLTIEGEKLVRAAMNIKNAGLRRGLIGLAETMSGI